jgi:ribosomal protein L32
MTMFGGFQGFRSYPVADTSSARASSQAAAAGREVDALEDQLGRLAMVCEAMWELIQERTDLTEEDLITRVKEIDMRDGEADGKKTRQIAKCTRCGRTMHPRHRKCLYCGQEELKLSAFDGV